VSHQPGEVALARLQLLHVRRRQQHSRLFDHQQRPADAARVGCDVEAAVGGVQLHRHKFADHAGPAELADRLEQNRRPAVHPEDQTVQEDQVPPAGVQVVGAEEVQVLHAQIEAEPPDGGLLVVGGDVGGQSQVLDQATRLALGGVARA
jgi:hypothetical protein